MEFAIIRLWQINITNLIQIKAALSKNFHIQPSELNIMPYWEYEMFVDELNRQVKEENDKQEADMKKAGVQDAIKHSNPKNIRNMINQTQPKMPSMPNIPSIGMPLKW